ncbi:hypothetical protein Y1Q_0010606 [Alligator mississippiensis]|uniref:Uncharacterized protein n=1 Tax=Alligator mississippiensis TaxID=8496 RepID=A0A151PGH3_ALLMI|nr:hypothetical protein Y1Q_0010606 [Alligator mississippiensis]
MAPRRFCCPSVAPEPSASGSFSARRSPGVPALPWAVRLGCGPRRVSPSRSGRVLARPPARRLLSICP